MHRGRGRPAKYPWSCLRIGDSFIARDILITSMSRAVQQARLKYGHIYTTRTKGNDVRVTRIA